ncbi:uncharacterized protein FIBRA_04504 [Fibroporia radiculosa]|uniref:PPP4R2-domain-containing protein n=1 Tax=Fibroporia radiculosa TaxID=599839 RepID=J4IA72_9APHY|nr:uncharacterized protein FIBRA_04504 [Fibroporia radiculosa]CCM02406.1 predicted protein [Fibroporia radiculosa]
MSSFEWKQEHDDLLEEVASTDVVDISKWTLLRDIIKYKIDKNVSLFLSGEIKREYEKTTVIAAPCPGGLKLPPFPPRLRDTAGPNEIPKNALNEKEAAEYRDAIFTQLDDFDQSPPFTIQRVCELCIRPTEHYKQLGKYLRAVERSILVTSTWDAFPVPTEASSSRAGVSQMPIGINPLSIPATPIFSPIPFLHEDARRSSSRSPPPSPLVLPAMSAGGAAVMPIAGAEGPEQKALGLVDELDDPSPGHLSDHPQPLTATTTVTSKPLFGSLEQRFVRAKIETSGEGEKIRTNESKPDDNDNKADGA